MMRVDAARTPVPAALRLGLLAGSLAIAGCSAKVPDNKSDDPALKASMQKSMAIYKSKAPPKAASKTKQGYAIPPRPRN